MKTLVSEENFVISYYKNLVEHLAILLIPHKGFLYEEDYILSKNRDVVDPVVQVCIGITDRRRYPKRYAQCIRIDMSEDAPWVLVES